MKLAYLIEDTDLSGGVRVVLAQADALIVRGHDVTIITKGLPLTWRSSAAEWRYVGDFSEVSGDDFDFAFATFWTTVAPARSIFGDGRVVHLCQGYEGSFSHYRNIKERIDEAYRSPIAKFVVSRPLLDVCRQFHSDVAYIGQIVDEPFFRDRPRDHEPPFRLLLAGPSQIDTKGIEIGYGAALHARWRRATFDLIRISPWAPSREEPLDAVAEFHVALTTSEVVKLVHSCDLFLGPNQKEEGFGLPAAEALAAAIPSILTRIPSYLAFSESSDFALFGEPDDATELGDQIVDLLEDEDLRAATAQRGRRVAEQFRGHLVAERIEALLLARKQ